ncbi:cytochrome c family protein [Paracoccus sp. p3-h83]|uniref:c-type cytochrome n=1 Tax=Paracoccus sp. p3-h83 TaxID=3342805 RepID=UPI0035BA4DA6
MFNTMTITKTLGALLGSALFLLLLLWAGSGLFNISPAHHAEGEAPDQAYVIATGDGAGAPVEAEPVAKVVDVAAVLAAGDAAAGEKLWARCRACHTVDGTDRTGPHLNGVVNRDKASIAGFNYSQAAIDLPGVWTPENLFEFLRSPKDYMPGTRMAFAGLPSDADRANLIAWLATQQ